MKDEYKCPAPENLLAWLDGELEDEPAARHVGGCPACQDFVNAVREENELLRAMLDAVPAPDLTGRVAARIEEAGRVMAGVEEAGRSAGSLFNIFSYLVTAGVGFALVLAYSILPGLINFELRPVAAVKALTALDRLVAFIEGTLKFIAAQISPGDPLIPPLIIVLAALLVNLIGKRRLSDV